jgi:exosortase
MNREMPAPGGRTRTVALGMLLILVASLLWSSWPDIREMLKRWSGDARYSHGFLVPAFALYLLWRRREMLLSRPVEPSWWGLSLVVVGAAMKLAGARYYLLWIEPLSLLPTLAGVAWLVGGRTALRWAWPAIGFLFFMIPLPYRIEMSLGSPLQRIATLSSTYALQTMGLPVVPEGNVILLENGKIGVVEACNGLGMLFMFFAVTVGSVLVVDRGPLVKGLVVLSAIPIAVAANVTRITMTGLLHETIGGRVADAVYHDLAGWLMMPLALAVLGSEFWLLARLIIEVAPEQPAPIGFLVDGDALSPDRREDVRKAGGRARRSRGRHA